MNNGANRNKSSCDIKTSRRGFLKTSVVSGSAIGMSASGSGDVRASGQNRSERPSITIAGYKFDRVEALVDGRIQVEGFDAKFEQAGIGDMNTHVFSGPGTREVTEIGLSPFMLAYANEGFRDYTLIPVFPLRQFRHKSIFVRDDRGIRKPADLRGRKIATPGYSSTSLTWIRGIMQHEYGVRPDEIQWVISTKDSSADAAGKISRQEQVMPEGIQLTRGPAGMDESDLLVKGEVDALFHAAEPRAYVQGNPIVARLFADYRKTERAYYAKTGIFPIMHAVAIRKDMIEKYPDFPKAVFDAYSQAKKLMYNHMRKLGWAMISLPWIAQEIEETRALMGENYWPYGIEPNRKALEALFRYSYEQGLAARKLTIEELFHPSTLELVES
ncbi:MAG: ABC transporter substrate-binding protein [Planctomycetota bacterium]|jgi:4,5-dihydroxyphthalate decarboxylase